MSMSYSWGARAVACALGLACLAAVSTPAVGQERVVNFTQNVTPADSAEVWPIYEVPDKPELSTLYHDGSQVVIQSLQRWQLMCGSNPSQVTTDNLVRWADNHELSMAAGPITVVDRGVRAGLNIIYSTDASVPAAALPGLALAEAYLEGLFGDPITVSISVSFQSMGGGVIGATSPYYVTDVTYTTSRSGLVDGMDTNDTIEAWLPTTSYCPVRYNGGSSTVSNESYVDWTRANYRATVGSASSTSASMTFNTDFPFDYNPANGVSGSAMSFVDVMIHETGHALGFISGADNFGGINFTSLDLYRFQRTDGTGDYNPDTLEEFQARARLVDYNTPDDDHNSDIITGEYRMSDGTPYQASHFREQSPWIGLLDPAFTYGETHYPNYFSAADINMFDAIGWDNPPCNATQITTQPQGAIVTEPAPVVLTVVAEGDDLTYRWYMQASPLDDDEHMTGTHTPTLTISPTYVDDSGEYYVLVSGSCGDPIFSNVASIIVQPGGPTVCLGDANCDGQVTFADINGFVSAVTGGIFCDGTGDNADMDENGSVGFSDINPFVQLITSNPLPIICP